MNFADAYGMHELISENASALNHIKVRLRKKTFFQMPIYCYCKVNDFNKVFIAL